jgi:hypothetical protein
MGDEGGRVKEEEIQSESGRDLERTEIVYTESERVRREKYVRRRGARE